MAWSPWGPAALTDKGRSESWPAPRVLAKVLCVHLSIPTTCEFVNIPSVRICPVLCKGKHPPRTPGGRITPLQECPLGINMPRLIAVGYGQTHMVIFSTPYESTATRRRLNKKAKEKTKEKRAFSEAASLGRKGPMILTDSEIATQRVVVPSLRPWLSPP